MTKFLNTRSCINLLAILVSALLVFHGSVRWALLQEANDLKRAMEAKDKEWLIKAWEHPLTLLSGEERELFLVDHGHLGMEQQNEVLRKEVLPAKGIFLIDPGTFT